MTLGHSFSTYEATREGHEECVRVLLEAGARLQLEEDGKTPLLEKKYHQFFA